MMSVPLLSCSVDGKYVPQGKLGCAVLAMHSTKDVSASLIPMAMLVPLL